MRNLKFGLQAKYQINTGVASANTYFPLNGHEFLATTRGGMYKCENEIIKKVYNIKCSTAVLVKEYNLIVTVSAIGGELSVMMTDDIETPLISRFKTDQIGIFHILYSHKSKVLITVGSGIYVWKLNVKMPVRITSIHKPEVSITLHSKHSLNYDTSILNPPSFDYESELLYLPTKNGFAGFDIDGKEKKLFTKVESTAQTASSLCFENKKFLTARHADGFHLWTKNGTLLKKIPGGVSSILAIRFINRHFALFMDSNLYIFIIDIKTSKFFHCITLPSKPNSLTIIHKECPYLAICHGSQITMLEIVLPWTVWKGMTTQPYFIQRCPKINEAARVLIYCKSSIFSFLSPKDARNLTSAVDTQPSAPLSHFYDRGLFIEHSFDQTNTFVETTRVSQISENKRDLLFITTVGSNTSIFSTGDNPCKVFKTLEIQISSIVICKIDESFMYCFSNNQGELIFYNYSDLAFQKRILITKNWIKKIHYHHQSNSIIVVFENEVHLFDLLSFKDIQKITIKDGSNSHLIGNLLLFGCKTGFLDSCFVECVDGNYKLSVFEDNFGHYHDDCITNFAFSSDFFITVSLDRTLKIWNYHLSLLCEITFPFPLYACEILNGSRDILVGTDNEILVVKGLKVFRGQIDSEIPEIDNFDRISDSLTTQLMTLAQKQEEEEIEDSFLASRQKLDNQFASTHQPLKLNSKIKRFNDFSNSLKPGQYEKPASLKKIDDEISAEERERKFQEMNMLNEKTDTKAFQDKLRAEMKAKAEEEERKKKEEEEKARKEAEEKENKEKAEEEKKKKKKVKKVKRIEQELENNIEDIENEIEPQKVERNDNDDNNDDLFLEKQQELPQPEEEEETPVPQKRERPKPAPPKSTAPRPSRPFRSNVSATENSCSDTNKSDMKSDQSDNEKSTAPESMIKNTSVSKHSSNEPSLVLKAPRKKKTTEKENSNKTNIGNIENNKSEERNSDSSTHDNLTDNSDSEDVNVYINQDESIEKEVNNQNEINKIPKNSASKGKEKMINEGIKSQKSKENIKKTQTHKKTNSKEDNDDCFSDDSDNYTNTAIKRRIHSHLPPQKTKIDPKSIYGKSKGKNDKLYKNSITNKNDEVCEEDGSHPKLHSNKQRTESWHKTGKLIKMQETQTENDNLEQNDKQNSNSNNSKTNSKGNKHNSIIKKSKSKTSYITNTSIKNEIIQNGTKDSQNEKIVLKVQERAPTPTPKYKKTPIFTSIRKIERNPHYQRCKTPPVFPTKELFVLPGPEIILDKEAVIKKIIWGHIELIPLLKRFTNIERKKAIEKFKKECFEETNKIIENENETEKDTSIIINLTQKFNSRKNTPLFETEVGKTAKTSKNVNVAPVSFHDGSVLQHLYPPQQPSPSRVVRLKTANNNNEPSLSAISFQPLETLHESIPPKSPNHHQNVNTNNPSANSSSNSPVNYPSNKNNNNATSNIISSDIVCGVSIFNKNSLTKEKNHHIKNNDINSITSFNITSPNKGNSQMESINERKIREKHLETIFKSNQKIPPLNLHSRKESPNLVKPPLTAFGQDSRSARRFKSAYSFPHFSSRPVISMKQIVSTRKSEIETRIQGLRVGNFRNASPPVLFRPNVGKNSK
ncbi:hypothetical protein TRFO_26143 [Tritrichomonas foetus]|uniref:Uncharacterized protein n=1 Tax=Tritrichomonas foetus TaxID=1144522 RepID=A0A1J4K919_9EUKA|nr:hypothetical protein TRFO_26143 [Tritrichomonas foetus]|eukprot:OHT05933.1 hypothetical protein TRFO_26143 [Tritrichomonas foetus]